MAQQIQIRRGNASEWTSINPLLAEGELGVELDTLKWKVGNGDLVWSLLPYSTESGLGLFPPHEALMGPSSGVSSGVSAPRLIEASDIPFVPALSADNVFTNVQKIPGIRLGTRVVTGNFTLTSTDFGVWVDATSAQIEGQLPPALGTGQIFRVKKGDTSVNLVNVHAAGTDTIDGETYVPLRNYKDDLIVRDAKPGTWDRYNLGGGGGDGEVDLSDVAKLSLPNFFQDVNTFNGIRLTPRLITTSGVTLNPQDSEIVVDATSGDLSIFLPPSTGEGQEYHIKKVDNTAHTISVMCDGTDLIDGSSEAALSVQWMDVLLRDAQTGYWDNVLAGTEESFPTVIQIGPYARFKTLTSPNGISLELFNGTSWIARWTETV